MRDKHLISQFTGNIKLNTNYTIVTVGFSSGFIEKKVKCLRSSCDVVSVLQSKTSLRQILMFEKLKPENVWYFLKTNLFSST